MTPDFFFALLLCSMALLRSLVDYKQPSQSSICLTTRSASAVLTRELLPPSIFPSRFIYLSDHPFFPSAPPTGLPSPSLPLSSHHAKEFRLPLSSPLPGFFYLREEGGKSLVLQSHASYVAEVFSSLFNALSGETKERGRWEGSLSLNGLFTQSFDRWRRRRGECLFFMSTSLRL